MNEFKTYENLSVNDNIHLEHVLKNLVFNDQNLIPAIAQQKDTGEVLMMAWMNRASIEETLKTGRVCYWSRSRQQYWRKGESSGHEQHLISMRADCDGDALLLLVNQTGPACHTNRRSCFYVEIGSENCTIISEKN
mgnify:CR=1 FL=1